MGFRHYALALACLAVSTSTSTASGAAPAAPAPAPQPVSQLRYADAPPPLREYFLKAREADAIKDPMKRCLAFPEVPGSRWPKQLIPQHCQYTFGFDHFTLATVRSRLEAGDLAGLDQLYRNLLERHFSDIDFSEHIHNAFSLFGSSYEAGKLSKLWLELAPESPFAMTARASFYENMGWAARGQDWSSETPPEQMQRLTEMHVKAIALYRQALAKEPRLMPAHAGLVGIAMNGGRLGGDVVFEAGRKIDPACKVLMSDRMKALEPRWGGSYPAMLALERDMIPHLERRPLLALSRIWPYQDLHDVLFRAEKYDEAAAALLPMVAVSSSPQVFEDLAIAMSNQKSADRWQELAYLIAATRYRPGRASVARERGRLQLLTARDAELANRSLAGAVEQEPEDGYAHYLYAASFGRLGKYDDAEREYLRAMKDDNAVMRRDSLIELGEFLIHGKRIDKARLYASRAIAEYPDDARSWRNQAQALMLTKVQVEPVRKALEQVLAKIDHSDARNAKEIAGVRRTLAEMRAVVEKHGGKW